MPTQIPTTWTDTGISWDHADPMWPLELLNPCLIEAIKEKDAATGRTVPTLLSADYNPILPNWYYVSAIHAEVTALIPLFVNHLLPTAHPGDYNGETTIPNWTEATILAAIGDSARIILTHLSTLSAWYFQTRKILDMMRWRNPELNTTGSIRTTGPCSPSQFESFWNTSSWLETLYTGAACVYGTNIWGYPGMVNGARYRRIISVHNINWAAELIYDVYVKCDGGGYEYNPEIAPYENVLYKTETQTKILSGFTELTRIGFIDSSPNQNSGLSYVWETGFDPAQCVIKFDGPNGFKFKADTPST